MTEINRRIFIKSAGLAFGSVLLFPACLKQSSIYHFFSNEEALCMIALCEQIIPKDSSPGATNAGVIFYIDKQLSGIFQYDQETYRTGIKNLQDYCSNKSGKSFEKHSAEDQIQIMKLMESNQMSETEWSGKNPANFFNLLLSHTMQGFYGSPIHGGNKDNISFKMLRIDYPLVVDQNQIRS